MTVSQLPEGHWMLIVDFQPTSVLWQWTAISSQLILMWDVSFGWRWTWTATFACIVSRMGAQTGKSSGRPRRNALFLDIVAPYSSCEGGKCTSPDKFLVVDEADNRLGCQRMEPAAYCTTYARLPDTFVRILSIKRSYNDLVKIENVNIINCLQQCLDSCYCQAVISNITLTTSNGNVSECWHKRDVLLNGEIQFNVQSYLLFAGSLQRPSPSPVPQVPLKTLRLVPFTLGPAVVILANLYRCSVTTPKQITDSFCMNTLKGSRCRVHITSTTWSLGMIKVTTPQSGLQVAACWWNMDSSSADLTSLPHLPLLYKSVWRRWLYSQS